MQNWRWRKTRRAGKQVQCARASNSTEEFTSRRRRVKRCGTGRGTSPQQKQLPKDRKESQIACEHTDQQGGGARCRPWRARESWREASRVRTPPHTACIDKTLTLHWTGREERWWKGNKAKGPSDTDASRGLLQSHIGNRMCSVLHSRIIGASSKHVSLSQHGATSGTCTDVAAATARNLMDAAKLLGHGYYMLFAGIVEAFHSVVREVDMNIDPDNVSLAQHIRKLGLISEQTDGIIEFLSKRNSVLQQCCSHPRMIPLLRVLRSNARPVCLWVP